VIDAQARLVAQWMGVGFIHGVMNTDNTSVAGETIDYGPCAFMDAYRSGQVFSSIDHYGRYAYNRQPDVLVWNLAQLATALLPLMGEDRDAAIEAATEAVHRFPDLYQAAWLGVFRAKIGLTTEEDEDAALLHTLLSRMETLKADFTNTFRALGTPAARDEFLDPSGYDAWERDWRARLAREEATPEGRRAAMERANPSVIPRTHRIEAAIAAGVAGDFTPFERLVEALARPFADSPEDLRRPPAEDEVVRQTFCGT
jgi:serine/tyrosine/threonine adenylyltransferase